MAKFKIIISEPKTGKSKSIEIEGNRAAPLIGRRLGDIIDGSLFGIPKQELKITGGSDMDGFPMRPDVHGGVRVRAIISGGVGLRSKGEGKRKRKSLRGNVITEEIAQINMKILKNKEK